MALRIVQSPGCSDVLTKDELGLQPGEILIDTGRISESIGYNPADPGANRALLRVAARMRSLGIQAAVEEGVDGIMSARQTRFPRRSNGCASWPVARPCGASKSRVRKRVSGSRSSCRTTKRDGRRAS